VIDWELPVANSFNCSNWSRSDIEELRDIAMTSASWKDIVEYVGISAIVASLIFVGLQMQQTQSIAVSQVMSANAGHRIASNIAIAEHADVWVKANSGAELNAAESLLVDKLIDNVFTVRASLWVHYQGLGREKSADRILANYAGFLHRNPGIYDRWLAREARLISDRTILMGAEYSLADWVGEIRTRIEILEREYKGNTDP